MCLFREGGCNVEIHRCIGREHSKQALYRLDPRTPCTIEQCIKRLPKCFSKASDQRREAAPNRWVIHRQGERGVKNISMMKLTCDWRLPV